MQSQICVDLHTHSYRSDGTISPEALVVMAKERNLAAIALTDHDTLDGVEEFMEAGKKHGVETIAGVEIGCSYDGFHKPELHIVGLGVDMEDTKLKAYLLELLDSRIERNKQMIQKLCDLGCTCTVEELNEVSGGAVTTRGHFAKLLLQKGYIKDMEEAFQKYINDGKPAYVHKVLPSPQEIVKRIKAAGGLVILAHPTLYRLNFDQLDEMCKELVSYGLDGIECYYSTYSPEQRKAMLALAKKHNLLISGGSDFHGSNKPTIQLGIGKGNLEVPKSCWDAMKIRLEEMHKG